MNCKRYFNKKRISSIYQRVEQYILSR